MSHLSDQFLESSIKVEPENKHKKIIAYLIYLSEELPVKKERGMVGGNIGVFSIFNGTEIDMGIQYVSIQELERKFGCIDFKKLNKSKISYTITGEESFTVTTTNVFLTISIDENQFGFELNLNGLRKCVKDYEFYSAKARFLN